MDFTRPRPILGGLKAWGEQMSTGELILDLLFLGALLVATLAQSTFLVLFWRKTKWWAHFVNRALFFKSAMFGITLWLTMLNGVVSYPGQLVVTVVVMWLVAAACFGQMISLVAQLWPDRIPAWLAPKVGAEPLHRQESDPL